MALWGFPVVWFAMSALSHWAKRKVDMKVEQLKSSLRNQEEDYRHKQMMAFNEWLRKTEEEL